MLLTIAYTLIGLCLLAGSLQLAWRGWRAYRRSLDELVGQVVRLEASGPEESERYYLYLNSEEASLARFDIPFHFFAHLRVGDRIRVRYFPGMNWIRELRILEGRYHGITLWDKAAKSQAPGWWGLAAALAVLSVIVLTRQ